MTLEQLEQMALAQAQLPGHFRADQLARAVLDMLPVVRVAARVKRECSCDYDYRCGNCQAVIDLRNAIATLNAKMKETV